MNKLRKLLGLLACVLAVAFLILAVLAVDSQGRISRTEFVQVAAIFISFGTLIGLWAYIYGDQADEKDAWDEEPPIL